LIGVVLSKEGVEKQWTPGSRNFLVGRAHFRVVELRGRRGPRSLAKVGGNWDGGSRAAEGLASHPLCFSGGRCGVWFFRRLPCAFLNSVLFSRCGAGSTSGQFFLWCCQRLEMRQHQGQFLILRCRRLDILWRVGDGVTLFFC